MNIKIYSTVLAMTLFLAACSETTVNSEAEGELLMQLSREWSTLISSGDLESGMNFWSDDAVMLPPDLPLLDGKDSIRAYVEGAAKIPGFSIRWEPISAHISLGGDMAYLIENNVIEFDDAEGNKVVSHGKVITVWRKDVQGDWKNVVDIWNAAPPPAE